jgi:hypothetical protein
MDYYSWSLVLSLMHLVSENHHCLVASAQLTHYLPLSSRFQEKIKCWSHCYLLSRLYLSHAPKREVSHFIAFSLAFASRRLAYTEHTVKHPK